MRKIILVTGGAGFIGSNFVLEWLKQEPSDIINLDKLTYAGNLANLVSVQTNPRYTFVHGDIGDTGLVARLFAQHQPEAVFHFAAESHVDRSIHGPKDFVETNVLGTFVLLEAARQYWTGLPPEAKAAFRFVHVSTDEVYGSLGPADSAFEETTAYAPNSPYSASKAASDHLVRSYFHTYGLPTLTTNCSNNYGPFQFPEKLIPLIIFNALSGKSLPIYGDGMNVRDWLYVGDHCVALRTAFKQGRVGETYNIGGSNERTNREVVDTICKILDEAKPDPLGTYSRLISFVADRPGHDRRYAINAKKLYQETGWQPHETFESGIAKTVSWYLANLRWIENIITGEYRNWIVRQYGASGSEALNSQE